MYLRSNNLRFIQQKSAYSRTPLQNRLLKFRQSMNSQIFGCLIKCRYNSEQFLFEDTLLILSSPLFIKFSVTNTVVKLFHSAIDEQIPYKLQIYKYILKIESHLNVILNTQSIEIQPNTFSGRLSE